MYCQAAQISTPRIKHSLQPAHSMQVEGHCNALSGSSKALKTERSTQFAFKIGKLADECGFGTSTEILRSRCRNKLTLKTLSIFANSTNQIIMLKLIVAWEDNDQEANEKIRIKYQVLVVIRRRKNRWKKSCSKLGVKA